MNNGIIFQIPGHQHQMGEPYPVELAGDNGAKLLEMLHLPMLPSFTLDVEQLSGLHSAIADLIQYDGDLARMSTNYAPHNMQACSTAGYFIRQLRELSSLSRFAKELNLPLQWEPR